MTPKKSVSQHKGLEQWLFICADQWESWLAKNCEQFEGIWIQFAKKGSGQESITYEEAREVAIRFGWIDGLINSLSGDYYLRKFTPRRPGSKWSKINREIAEQLIQKNKMFPSGLAEVEAARSDGRWAAAYDSQSTMEVPAELEALLAKNQKAQSFFEQISRAERYAFLYRIQNSKKPETRRKHISKTMRMLTDGEVYHRTTGKPTLKKSVKKRSAKPQAVKKQAVKKQPAKKQPVKKRSSER